MEVVVSGTNRPQEVRWGEQSVISYLNEPGMSKNLHEVEAAETASKPCQLLLNALSCAGLDEVPW